MTSHRRQYDIILTACARWDVYGLCFLNIFRKIKRFRIILLVGVIVTISFLTIQELQPFVEFSKTRSVTNSRKQSPSSSSTRAPNSIPVLLWWDSVYTSVDDVRTCGTVKCHVTSNRSLHHYPDPKVYLFYGSHFKPYNLPFPRKKEDIWALIHEESPRNAYILSHNGTMNIFNITSTYSRNSSYPVTTQWLQCSDWLEDTEFLVSLEAKNKLRRRGMAPILYLHSDCGVPSDRDHYVKMLQKYIKVDSYGTCLMNKKLPERLRFRDTMAPLDDVAFFRWAAKYKFTLAMENYVCDDYVTEKLWRPLRLGSIPIVFGAPNVKNFLPDNHSAIVIEDFDDIKQLADYIRQVDANDTMYMEYLQFKDRPLQNEYLQNLLNQRDWNPKHCKHSGKTHHLYHSIFEGFECYLCHLAHRAQIEKKLGFEATIRRANASHYGCPVPKRFDEEGKYNVYSDIWAEEWNYGKYEAVVMETLIQQNKIVSKKEFDLLVKTAMKSDKLG